MVYIKVGGRKFTFTLFSKYKVTKFKAQNSCL